MSDTPELPLSLTGRDPLAIAVQAARQAGAILRKLYSQEIHIENKGKRNLVTEADLQAEKSILELLNHEYPDHSILCEESGKTEKTGEYCWIIDPLDGTTNFAFGIPIFCVSIGLVYRDEVILGVIYDPLRGELFQARKGMGAFLNDIPISVGDERNLQTTVVGFDLGYDDERTREMISIVNKFWSRELTFRLIGSAALGITYVACGRMDIYCHRRIYPWDIAAAMLLISEVGGEVTDWEGNPATVWNESIIACGDVLRHLALRTAIGKSSDL
ncbi:MAG: inositol monophosphatase family protein [Chloroflexota bacterium]|nr:inositol monophosphatase family protein [Chloroflexota bacterium]